MTTNKPGTVSQRPLYGCTNCFEDCTWPAGDLRVYDGECWCGECWDERDIFPGRPDWGDLDPYTPALQAENETLEQQRDALAALCQEAAAVLERTANDTLDGRNMAVRLRESPTSSLARLKAKWQSEALGHVLAEVLAAVEADTVRAHLRNAMRKLRRQAEGGEV